MTTSTQSPGEKAAGETVGLGVGSGVGSGVGVGAGVGVGEEPLPQAMARRARAIGIGSHLSDREGPFPEHY